MKSARDRVIVGIVLWVVVMAAVVLNDEQFRPAIHGGLALFLAVVLAVVLAMDHRRSQTLAGFASKHGLVRGAATLLAGDEAPSIENQMRAARDQGPFFRGQWRGRDAETQGWRSAVALDRGLPRVSIDWRSAMPAATVPTTIGTESPDFDAAFRLEAADAELAHAIVHPRMIERLMRPDAAGTNVIIEGARVVVFRDVDRDFGGVGEQLDLAADIAELLPRFVYDRWSTESGQAAGAATRHAAAGASTERNWLAVVALACGMLIAFAPVGIVLGHRARAAVRSGQATNGLLASFALIASYTFTAALALAAVDFALGLT